MLSKDRSFESVSRSSRLTAMAACAAAVLALGAAAHADTAKKAPPKPAANATKGQSQVAGDIGRFGTIYTLKNGINFEILSARYQLTPFPCYNKLYARADEKLLVLAVAVKNVQGDDNFIGDLSGSISAFNDKGDKYDAGNMQLDSKGDAECALTLKPGQGYGQPGLDPLRMAIAVGRAAQIVKLILNIGRAGKSEDAIRFYLADATVDNAGGVGDPLNVIAPLPDGQHDPADKIGCVVPEELPGGKPGGGTIALSADYGVTLDSLAYAAPTAQFGGNPADDGKRYVVATLTIRNLAKHDASVFDAVDTDTTSLKSTDGDKFNMSSTRKAHSDDEVDTSHAIPVGGSYVVREIFMVPTGAQLSTYTYCAGNGHKWTWDVSGVKP